MEGISVFFQYRPIRSGRLLKWSRSPSTTAYILGSLLWKTRFLNFCDYSSHAITQRSKMNQNLARCLLRNLFNGQSSSRYFSSYAINGSSDTLEAKHRSYIFFGISHLRRSLSSAPSSAEEAVLAEKDRKENSVKDGAERRMGERREDGSVMVSSYWGIARPKITREDGTVWPWNCFMVRRRIEGLCFGFLDLSFCLPVLRSQRLKGLA